MSGAIAWLAGGLAATGAAILVGGGMPSKRVPDPHPAVDGSASASAPPDRRFPTPVTGADVGRPAASGRGAAGRGLGHRIRPWHAAVAGVVLAPIAPVLVPAPLAMVVLTGRLDQRRQRRRHDDAVADELPDLVDLLRLTTLAGLPVSAALRAVGGRPGGVVGPAISQAVRLFDRGATTVRALAAITDACGPAARSLVDALTDHDRYGTPLGASLDRVAVEYRLRRRRRAEEAARRLPVTLLFPLVLATLPAFVILTIVPLLVGSFQMLRL